MQRSSSGNGRVTPVWRLAVAMCVGVAGVATICAQQAPAPLEVIQLRQNFFVLAGAGGNISVQFGEDGVVLVDAGATAKSDAVLAAIKALSPRPIRYVINTNADDDHVGGNLRVAAAGQTLFTLTGAQAGTTDDATTRITNSGATILAAEPVMNRMSAPTGKVAPYSANAWPTETFLEHRSVVYLNGEGIESRHQPDAHTDGDSFVFFRRSDVVAAGDILDTTRFPVIDTGKGGSIQGELSALNRLIEMTVTSVPIVSRSAGTFVVPGHGYVCDQFDVVEYRDMVAIITDRVRDLITAGKTLQQVQDAKPARGYAGRYGSDTGAWTTKMFVEAIYTGLKSGK